MREPGVPRRRPRAWQFKRVGDVKESAEKVGMGHCTPQERVGEGDSGCCVRLREVCAERW